MTAVLREADPTQKRGKPSPATQMREMLVKSRRFGVPFDKAWGSAFDRVRWPHDTDHRISWKEQLEEDRRFWEAAYDRSGEVNQPLVSLYALLCEYGTEPQDLLAA